jgi:hypothetical protein
MMGAASQSMLFVRPSPAVQREVYRVEGTPLWSAGFGQILEKQGFVAFDDADHRILEDAGRLSAYDLVIVCWMPERFWSEAMVRGLSGFAGAVVLEGPVPPALWNFAGFAVVEDGYLDRAVMSIPDPEIAAEMNASILPLRPSGSMALAEKSIKTRPSRLNRWDYDFDPAQMGLQDWARRIARLIRVTALNRLMKGQLGSRYEDCLFAAANLLLFLKKGGHLSEPERTALSSLISSLRTVPDQRRLSIPLGRKHRHNRLRLLAIVVALAEAVGLSRENGGGKHDEPARKTRNLSKVELQGLSILEREAGIQSGEPDDQNAGPSTFDPRHWKLFRKSSIALDAAVRSWESRISGDVGAANEMLLEIVRTALEPETGRLFNEGVAASARSVTTHPLIGLAFMSALSNPAEPGPVSDAFAERYGAARLAKWAKLGLQVQRVRSVRDGATVFLGLDDPASVDGNGARYTGACHRAKVVAYSFPILATIVSYHAVEPLNGAFTDCDSSTAILLEPVFFLALERLVAAAGTRLLRVEPWPQGSQYCLTIRHDVDRLPTQEHLASLLQFEKRRGLAATWFWIFNRLDADQIRQQERAGHEVALHAMKFDNKGAELERLTAALSTQPGIYGECQHGGGGGDYWLGHPNVQTSHDNGLLYSEGNSCLYGFPYRWPWLDDEGAVRFYDIVCMSHDVSVDKPRPSPTSPGWNSGRLRCMRGNSGHIMVLNHPDAYLDRLVEIVDQEFPADGRLDWNCRQVAEWWRATHSREHVGVRFGRDGIVLRPRYAAQNVVFSVAGLKEEERPPAQFREMEVKTSSMGLRYRRFAVDLVADPEEIGGWQARPVSVSADQDGELAQLK